MVFAAGSSAPDYYAVLQVTRAALDTSEDPDRLLRQAYRRSLLRHHPDKQARAARADLQRGPSSPPSGITVDHVSAAFAVLSDPQRRADYDRLLRLGASGTAVPLGWDGSQFQTGVENVDLDDLDFEDGDGGNGGEWYRDCRCGNPRGYRFGEADLEEEAEYGELMVGCRDCSLWLRVHFAVVEEDENEGKDVDEGGERREEENGLAGITRQRQKDG